jgi:hypothetical protein
LKRYPSAEPANEKYFELLVDSMDAPYGKCKKGLRWTTQKIYAVHLRSFNPFCIRIDYFKRDRVETLKVEKGKRIQPEGLRTNKWRRFTTRQ